MLMIFRAYWIHLIFRKKMLVLENESYVTHRGSCLLPRPITFTGRTSLVSSLHTKQHVAGTLLSGPGGIAPALSTGTTTLPQVTPRARPRTDDSTHQDLPGKDTVTVPPHPSCSILFFFLPLFLPTLCSPPNYMTLDF